MSLIKPGQLWADKDPREAGRTVRINHVDARYAYVATVTPAAGRSRVGHRTRITLERIRRDFLLVDGGTA